MLKGIKHKLTNKDSRVLLSNFSYMTLIEITNYVLPFISIPYLVRVIGVDKYGTIMFAYAVITLLGVITSYSFRLLAPKYISLNRGDPERLSQYFWSVIFTQLFLLLISSAILTAMVFSIDKFNQEKIVFFYSFILIIGNIMFPVWFFQGIEKMKYIAVFNMVSKIIYTLMVFLLIQDSNDYVLVPLLSSLSILGVGLVSLYKIKKDFNVHFFIPSFTDIKSQLMDGRHLFQSTLFNTLYTSINTILLGFLTNYTAVGILSLATTISNAITKIIKIYSSVTFPYMAKYTDNKEELISKARFLLKTYSLILFFTGLITVISAPYLIPFIYGDDKEASILLLQILGVIILFEPLGSFFTSYLVIKNEGETISKIAFYTMLLNLLLIVPFILLFQALGIVMVKFIVEGFHTILNINSNKELFKSVTVSRA